jgi:hypothetical protein
MCSAVLNGSMTPQQILWDIEKAFGAQLCALWWSEHYDPNKGGVRCMKTFGAKREQWVEVL